jgi:hypothetical protein
MVWRRKIHRKRHGAKSPALSSYTWNHKTLINNKILIILIPLINNSCKQQTVFIYLNAREDLKQECTKDPWQEFSSSPLHQSSSVAIAQRIGWRGVSYQVVTWNSGIFFCFKPPFRIDKSIQKAIKRV